MSFLEGGLHKIQNEKLANHYPKKCTWHSFAVFKCNWENKCTPLSNNTQHDKKKNHNKWNKNTTHRKKYKPASSILLCSFRGCIIFTSPPPKKKKKPTPWYCTASPAVLSPLHFSNPPPPPPKKAQINNMLLIYTRRWRYKIEIITVHVQHAGLIFNADFFVLFSIYIRI